MFEYIEKIAARLTDNDRRQLSDIYEPTEVAIPDQDPVRCLCVTDDGRIRFWGKYRKQSVFDEDCARCYIESCDGGLSWKRYVVEDKNVLGASWKIPFDEKGRYIALDFKKGVGTILRRGASQDDAHPEEILVTEQHSRDFRPPFFDEEKKRIIFVACENRFDIHPTAFFSIMYISDDCGDTWKVQHLPGIPLFEIKPPHKGKRWEQNTRENTVVPLSDGRLMMLTRTSEDYHYVYYSDDHGDTWSDPSPTAFHSTGTMPLLSRLSDGRIVFLFCNTKLLPELETADGIWEDVFTNRDAAHITITEDDGENWIGMRELALDSHRHAHDFRSVGGPECNRDKSVHQFEMLELPMGKLLVAYGQHYVCRRIVILDVNWLYERTRKEDFIHGLRAISAQSYVKSILGSYKGRPEAPCEYVGHCAYNRTCSVYLMPSPDENGKEALCLRPNPDDRLLTHISGATWNFPIARKGTVKIRMHTEKALRLSLLDFWMNPTDYTVADFAPATVILTPEMQRKDTYYTDVELSFDCDAKVVLLSTDAGFEATVSMNADAHAPYGLCYLHLQTTDDDCTHASFVARIDYTMQ